MTNEPDGKQPHYFSGADGGLLPFAGLWDRWRDPETGEEVLSCTMVVSGASEWMAPYHDRMPALLAEADFDRWLSGEVGTEVLKPARESALREWPVARRVNKTGVGVDDPKTIAPLA